LIAQEARLINARKIGLLISIGTEVNAAKSAPVRISPTDSCSKRYKEFQPRSKAAESFIPKFDAPHAMNRALDASDTLNPRTKE
jgi:hypothetical protein